MDEIVAICEKHGALIIEDAAESFGATYHGVQTGKFGDYSTYSEEADHLSDIEFKAEETINEE